MTNADLQSLGNMLQEAREEQALSLQEVEAQTRIRVKFLEALESGDISILPSATHARGFLRNYAQFLRLDVDSVIAQFAELTGTNPNPITQVTAPQWTPTPPAPPDADRSDEGEEIIEATEAEVDGEEEIPSPVPPVVPPPPITHSTYISPGRRSGPGLPAGYTPPSEAAQPVRAPIAQPQSAAVETERPHRERGQAARIIRSPLFSLGVLMIGAVIITVWAVSRLNALADQRPEVISSSSMTNTPDDFDPLATEEPEETETPEGEPVGADIPLITDRVVLEITVEQRSWVRIDVDGETALEGQVGPGDLLRYEAEEVIDVRAGNGAALRINYNGQDIGTLGARGEVVERNFRPDSVEDPTPTPTLEPTNTLVPSPTPPADEEDTSTDQ